MVYRAHAQLCKVAIAAGCGEGMIVLHKRKWVLISVTGCFWGRGDIKKS